MLWLTRLTKYHSMLLTRDAALGLFCDSVWVASYHRHRQISFNSNLPSRHHYNSSLTELAPPYFDRSRFIPGVLGRQENIP